MANIYDGTFVLGSTTSTNISAGPGIKFDTSVPGVIGISNDETELFTSDTSVSSFSTTEPIENFKYLKVIVEVANGVNAISNVVMTDGFTNYLSLAYLGPHTYGEEKTFYMWRINYTRSGNTYTWKNGAFVGYAGTQVTGGDAGTNRGKVLQVIGCNRIAGGN